ncbi:hypothetical protein ACQHIV_38165 [Kribbella sp. GL6]|uniref:hypothetical protein n=1 Tax=Kribbella sp. GL6 TaxID=3419765 RepID=UPI003D001046
MSSVVVINFTSLDGVVQAPLRADEDTDDGRRTYGNFVADWEQTDPTEPAIAAMNRMPKYLVSQTPDRSRLAQHGPSRPRPARRSG